MRVYDLVSKAGDVAIRHGISVVAGIDALNNVCHGNYQLAALEATLSAGMEISSYIRRKNRKAVDIHLLGIQGITQQLGELNQQLRENQPESNHSRISLSDLCNNKELNPYSQQIPKPTLNPYQ